MSILLLLLMQLLPVQAQNFHIKSYSTRDGLPANRVSGIVQDKQGFIWLGTYNGLARYDGRTFKTYFHNPEDPASISADSVTRIYMDSSENLWVGMISEGLNRFDYQNGVFEQYLAGETVLSIFENKIGGGLWVGTFDGLIKLSGNGEIEKRYKAKHAIDSVFRVNGDLYFSTRVGRHGDLYKLLDDQAVLVKKDVTITFSLPNRSQAGSYWMGSTKKLYLYMPEENKWEAYLDGFGAYKSAYYDSETLVVGTLSKGIIFFDAKKKKMKFNLSAKSKGALNVLVSDSIKSIFKDDSGLLWSGTDAGLMKIKPSVFSGHLSSSEPDAKLKAKYIGGFLQDGASIWMGTDYHGIMRYDTLSETFEYYPHPEFDKIYVMDIKRADDEHILVGSRKGLLIFNTKKAEWVVYKQNEYLDKTVFSMADMGDGKFLLATNIGLVEFDFNSHDTKIYRHDSNDSNSLKNDLVVNVISLSEENQYAVSTVTGLSLFDASKGRFNNSLYTPPGNKKNQIVENTFEDSKGRLWVNHGSSIAQVIDLFSGKPKFTYYIKNRDWVGRRIEHVIEDDAGGLWLATRSGLLRFGIDDKQFLPITFSDGLPLEEFSGKIPLLTRSGDLYFAAIGGLVKFDPDDIRASDFQPPVYVTDVHIDSNPISVKRGIKITHEHRAIRIRFIALDYDASEKNQYAYKLEGFDEQWVNSGVRNEAVYTNIPPGRYTFYAKGTNSDGVWSDEVAKLDVYSAPPWWLSAWAYLLYVILCLTVIAFIVKIRTLQIRHYAKALEKEVLERTSVIEALLDKKNELFAHVSHELRTPLTLIMGPINQILQQEMSGPFKQKIQMIQRNSHRLLKMVDQLLALAKATTPGLIERSPQNATEIARLIVASVKPLAMEKNIEIELNCSNNLWVEMMPDAFETILLNFCVNAIKYTPAGGKIHVDVFPAGEKLELRVSDTGPGIPTDQQRRIFERFTRISKDGQGVGLGLALVKELVDVHDGEILLESIVGSGATFLVKLPLLPVDSNVSTSGLQIPMLNTVVDTWLDFGQTEDKGEITENLQENEGLPQILIIDDEPDMGSFLQSALSDYQTRLAHDGEEGIELATKHVPDLILSDIMMPGKDGFEVVKAIRENINTSHIPIILITAKGDRESRLKAYEGYADDFITKPFDANELLVRIQSLLAVRDLVKQRFSGQSIEQVESSAAAFPGLHSKDKDFLNQFREMITAHYQDSSFSVKEMRVLMNMSERPLQRKLKALLGLTPNNYLKIYRLERAAEYLKNSDLPVEEILNLIGMQSRSHFYAYFKAYFGVTPKECRSSRQLESSLV